MKLDRNTPGGNKYIVIATRKLGAPVTDVPKLAKSIQAHPEAVSFGEVGSADEFFVLRLKDRHAAAALEAYAAAARADDPEYADEVLALAKRSGPSHPLCKRPD